MTKLIRLQKMEWNKLKSQLTLTHYCISRNGHVKGFYQDLKTKKRFTHWLNDNEIANLKKNNIQKISLNLC